MATKQAMPAEPDWLKANATGRPIGVDRENDVIRGYIVAQEGPFKSEGRGEFDVAALKQIVKLMKTAPNGLKSRFAHPDLSSDGIGKLLGRSRNPRMDMIGPRESDGTLKVDEVAAVRADLFLSPVSHNSPSGDIGRYVMDLAESDPDAMSSSLVLTKDEELRTDKKGHPARDEQGNVLPPLWRPTRLHASDFVDQGDAVDGVLSVDGLPDKLVRQASAMLDEQFVGQDRAVVQARAEFWLGKYLDRRFGAEEGALTPEDVEVESDTDVAEADVAEPIEQPQPEKYNPAADPELRRRLRKRGKK